MKKSILYIGITLVFIANVSNATNRIRKQNKLNQFVIFTDGTFVNQINYQNLNGDLVSTVAIEKFDIIKKEKTADELIAEDNAITNNTISNEVQPLNFNVINKKNNSKCKK